MAPDRIDDKPKELGARILESGFQLLAPRAAGATRLSAIGYWSPTIFVQVCTCIQSFMQVYTCVTPKADRSLPERSRSASVDQTRQRLLDAAAKVFSRDGFQGATTREIAREADVNEVTLFRHFLSRDELVKATLERGLMEECRFIEQQPSWSEDLRIGIANYVRAYNALLENKEALSRALIGEARLLPDSVRQMVLGLVAPLKLKLIALLRAAQEAGLVRQDVNLACAVDILRDALYSGMLARTAWGREAYSVDEYLETVIETFVRGIESRRS